MSSRVRKIFPEADPPLLPLLLLVLFALLGLGAVLRIDGLSAYYYSSDELLHVNAASKAGPLAVIEAAKVHFHPPLIYLILHYMLKLSRAEGFARCISLAPGLLTIPLFYFWGRRALGVGAGLVMAFLCAFGFGAVILSQVVRAYSLLMCAQTLALWALLAYFDTRAPRLLYVYTLAILVAGLVHYSSALPLFAMALVWIGRAARPGWFPSPPSAGPAQAAAPGFWPESRRIFWVHVGPAALIAAWSVSHLGGIFGQDLFAKYLDKYWKGLFPATLAEWGRALSAGFDYNFFPGAAWALIPLAGAGLVALWRRRRRELALIIVLTFAFNVGLTLIKAYPFGGSRHGLMLFPLSALAIAASLSELGGLAWAGRGRLARTPGWAARARPRHAAALVLCLLVSAATFYRLRSQEPGLRLATNPATEEFLVTHDDYNRVMSTLWERIQPTDLVVMDYQTLIYFQALYPDLTLNPWANVILSIDLRHGRQSYPGYIFFEWNLNTPEKLEDLFFHLGPQFPAPPGQVRFIQIGKIGPALFSPDSPLADYLSSQFLTPSAILLSFQDRPINP